jgi:hypothetical protein
MGWQFGKILTKVRSECDKGHRDVTFGSANSLGPSSVFPTRRPCTRGHEPSSPVPVPALPAPGVRAVLSAFPSPEPLLQRFVPSGGGALAALACESDLAGRRGRATLSSGAIAAVSASDSLAGSRRSTVVRAGRCRIAAGGRGVRGPAPSDNSCGLFRSCVRSSGLLRGLRGRRGVVGTAFLYGRVPPGVTQRAGSRSALPPPSPRGVSAVAAVIAIAAAVTSLAVVQHRSPAKIARTPGGEGRADSVVPIPRSFP